MRRIAAAVAAIALVAGAAHAQGQGQGGGNDRGGGKPAAAGRRPTLLPMRLSGSGNRIDKCRLPEAGPAGILI